MSEKDSQINNKNISLEKENSEANKTTNRTELIENDSNKGSAPKWINNKGEEVKQVFGFNENAELINARVAMIGFIMLLITELAFAGKPATQAIFGIN